MKESAETFVNGEIDGTLLECLVKRMGNVFINLEVPGEYVRSKEVIDEDWGVLIGFFSVASTLFDSICVGLHRSGCITPRTRVVLEKPIGEDLSSSREINDMVALWKGKMCAL